MEEDEFLKAEGDVNLSAIRQQWQENNLDEATKELLAQDEKYFIHQSLSTPCLNVLEDCDGIYLKDQQGRKLMDFHGNNVHQVGFNNPAVIDAVKEQLDSLSFCTRRYTNEKSIELAKRLTDLTPDNLNKVLFAPGGAEAVGMALKLARKVTGKFKVISMWDSFHGATLDTISIGGEATFRKDLGPLIPGVEHVLPMNTYRCVFGECEECDLKCIKYLEYVLERERDIGAIVVETIRNTDVQIPSKKYYQRLRELCDRHNVLLILDEIPIALGRTGEMFAFERYDIIPDMVIVGKGLGGGVFPLAALITREDFNVAKETALGHYTHEKTPVGAAAALATIDFIEDENLLEHVNQMNTFLGKQLEQLKEKYEIIGDIRGCGLLFAVELVTDRATKEKAVEEAEKIMYKCLEQGLSFKVSQGNVLTLSPALTIQPGELTDAVNILEKAIKDVISN